MSGLDIHGTVASGSPAVRFDDQGSTLQDCIVSGAVTGVFANGSGGGDGGDDAIPLGIVAPLFDFDSAVTVSNDDIHGVAIGIDFGGVGDGVIEDDDIHDLTGSPDDHLAAILLEDDNDNAPEDGNLIQDNTIEPGADTGIDVETSDNTIDGNSDHRRRGRDLPERRQRRQRRPQRDHEQRDHLERRGRDPARDRVSREPPSTATRSPARRTAASPATSSTSTAPRSSSTPSAPPASRSPTTT